MCRADPTPGTPIRTHLLCNLLRRSRIQAVGPLSVSYLQVPVRIRVGPPGATLLTDVGRSGPRSSRKIGRPLPRVPPVEVARSVTHDSRSSVPPPPTCSPKPVPFPARFLQSLRFELGAQGPGASWRAGFRQDGSFWKPACATQVPRNAPESVRTPATIYIFETVRQAPTPQAARPGDCCA